MCSSDLAIIGTSYVPMTKAEVVDHLRGLTELLVEALLADTFRTAAAHEVGIRLVEAHFTGTETLDRTIQLMGDELQLIQFGGMPKDAKPFKGIGSGVFEIALRHATDAYRTVVAVQLGKKVYVLHAFQKKSKKGIETAKYDVDLIKQRYAEAKERAKHEEN